MVAPPASARDYAIRHDDAWGTEVTNMTKVEVSSMEQINALMSEAAKKRSVGVTDMNAASSRSHSVFALYLKGVNADRARPPARDPHRMDEKNAQDRRRRGIPTDDYDKIHPGEREERPISSYTALTRGGGSY